MSTMMASGVLVLGAVFCLLGIVVLAGLAFLALRYFVGERPGEDTASHGGSLHRPPTDYVER